MYSVINRRYGKKRIERSGMALLRKKRKILLRESERMYDFQQRRIDFGGIRKRSNTGDGQVI